MSCGISFLKVPFPIGFAVLNGAYSLQTRKEVRRRRMERDAKRGEKQIREEETIKCWNHGWNACHFRPFHNLF